MIPTFRPGNDVVTYVDDRGRAHTALVTHWYGNSASASCNLVYLDVTIRDVRGLKPIQLDNIRAFDGLSRSRTNYWIPFTPKVDVDQVVVPT